MQTGRIDQSGMEKQAAKYVTLPVQPGSRFMSNCCREFRRSFRIEYKNTASSIPVEGFSWIQ
jgi:hypothetical protein